MSDYLVDASIYEKDLERLKSQNFKTYKCTIALFELAKVDGSDMDIRITKYLDKIARYFGERGNIDDCTKLFNFLFKHGVKGEILLDLIESKYQKDASKFRDAAWHLHTKVSVGDFYSESVADKLTAMAPQRKTPEEVIKELQEII